eukprot:365461-Chlamydomonas_euryale.AAC.2
MAPRHGLSSGLKTCEVARDSCTSDHVIVASTARYCWVVARQAHTNALGVRCEMLTPAKGKQGAGS